MTHGTFAEYTRGCRCTDCTEANRDHSNQYKRLRWYQDLTPEQRRHCLICGTALNVHPIRACWREV